MCIGGGTDCYIAYITYDNLSFYNLIDSTKSKERVVELVVGGQLGEFPSYLCVDKENVLKAAKTFVFHGTIENSLEYELISQ